MGGGPADHPVGGPFAFGDLGHAVVGEDLEGEFLVLWRHQATVWASSLSGSISSIPSYLAGITMSTP